MLAVDEGILQVARYKNPDPLGFFFQKRMLEVETRQILDLILPEFRRFLALAAPGGDARGGLRAALNPFNRKRKPPVAYWSGVIDVGPEGRELTLHRARLLQRPAAHRRDRRKRAPRWAWREAATEVKGDFILTPNVPAMVAPGDEFIVSVGVFNNTHGRQRADSRERAARRRACRSSGTGERRSADRRQEGRRRRVPHEGQRRAGRRGADVHRAPRTGRGAHGRERRACGRPSPTGRS